MPAPTVATYSAAALVGAATFFKNLIDAEASPGYINIRSAADVLLATVLLHDPCGTVNAGTGQLTLDIDGRDEATDTDGTAAYGEVCSGTGTVHLALPCVAGFAPVPGYLVLNSLTLVAGGAVEISSATIG